MPLYEYECESCRHRFELIRKFSDPPVEVCPVCGAAVRKLVSSPAIQFKGTGWYITDYSRKGKAPDTGGDGKPQTSAGPSDGSKNTSSSDASSSSSTTEKTTPASSTTSSSKS